MNRSHLPSVVQALIAALLFGASAPLAKLLLGEVEPIPLAALLYLGSGIGLLGVKLFQRMNQKGLNSEAQIKQPDYVWLVGAIIAGGVAAPITLLFSLQHTPAATASLLLNFESVATTLIAFFRFQRGNQLSCMVGNCANHPCKYLSFSKSRCGMGIVFGRIRHYRRVCPLGN